MWRQELLLAGPAAAILIGAIVIIALFAPPELGAGGRGFTGHRNDLAILSTSLDRTGTKPDFWMTGIVTNQGKYPWRVQELEVCFLDEHDNLLDVQHPDIKDSFVIQSGQEHGFRVELGGLAFTNSNVTRQVRVQMATDGNLPMKSD